MTVFETLQSIGLPCAYSHFRGDQEKTPPYLVYIGAGEDTFKADNTIYHKEMSYRVEYYFTEKNEALENTIENALLSNGYIYDKSEDVFIQEEGVFMIYYII